MFSFSTLRQLLHFTPFLFLCGLPAYAQTKPKAASPKPPILFVDVDYEMEDALSGLKFEQPLGVVTVPGEKSRLFIVEKTGRIQVVKGLEGSTPEKKTFLNLTQLTKATLETTGECGVLGLAFPVNHKESRQFYVDYSLKIGGVLHQRVSRFQLAENDEDQGDRFSEQPLITQQDEASNHNGGDLAFGPDGYLYISVGDGGAANDKFDTARFIDRGFHGAILRIDVDKKPGSLPPNPHASVPRNASGDAHYAVPADNPFIGYTSHHGKALDAKNVRTEIWATGLRNPWRMRFDPANGRLFCGDVGQNLYEEVNLITKGGDYGWSHREALHPFIMGPGGDKEPQGFKPVDPIFEYDRTVGLSITGGVVHHGNRLPQFKGQYVFADYVTGRVIALKEEGGKWKGTTLAQQPGIAGLGVDPRNDDVLFANLATGQITRLKPKSGSASEN